ncbi:MAG TPA: efflux RND transporter periplasmic adaptor subunit [Candidatus Binatia bacterium]|nr:efflux RND transporter periplasmic adaptor subunit [Candidatus Binatia bacterium]
MRRLRYPALIAAVVLVAALGYVYWRHADEAGKGEFVAEAIDQGTVAATVTANGTVNPVTTVQVGTYVSGPIQAIYVDYNSPVKKGQLVAKIDPALFHVKVLEAEANLANAKSKGLKDRADLAFKKLTLERNQQLRAKNLIAANDVDTARSDYDQAVAQLALDDAAVQQAAASLEESRINLNYTDIKSPVDGVVVSRSVDVGQTVAASFQTPTLFLIAQDLTKMQVDTSVSESDVGAVREQQPASFTVDAYPGKAFHGVVTQIRNAPITVQNVVTYDVVVGVHNPDLELKPGMTATVAITTAQRDNVLRIPLRALRFHPERKAGAPATPASGSHATTHQGQTAVWVLNADGTLRRVPVETGVRNEQYAEVISGDLREGDQVAVAYRHTTPPAQGTSQSRPPSFGGGRRF